MIGRLPKVLLYLGLLIGAGLFVYTNIGSDFQDFISGRTSYAVGRKPITLKDFPTWTLCFKLRTHKGEMFIIDNESPDSMIYQKDFTIEVGTKSEGEEKLVLLENQDVQILPHFEVGLEMRLVFLKTTNKGDQCYKLSSQLNRTEDIKWRNFELQLTFNFNKQEGLLEVNKVAFPLIIIGVGWGNY